MFGFEESMAMLDQLCEQAHELAEKYSKEEKPSKYFVLFKKIDGRYYYEGAYSEKYINSLANACFNLGRSKIHEELVCVVMSRNDYEVAKGNNFCDLFGEENANV